ncbi:hypothetical protein BJV82DRAFT_349896 [Fennellomyces sp. T-0311]|nr:hypothetical protein BJV82DRAFT_349896 [Fennellomyces sp. T-0311]
MASYNSAAATELPNTIDGLLWRMRCELNCPICLQVLTDIRSTPCGHSFCEACIKKALRSSAECPMCKQHVTQRGLYVAESLNLIVQDFLALREAYEKETGNDLSMPVPARSWRTDPVPDLSQRMPYPAKSEQAEQGTADPEGACVTSLEIGQATERQQSEACDEHVIAYSSIQDNNVLEQLAHLAHHHANVRKVSAVSEEVTCVVVATDDRRLAKHRTIKYLQAVLMGKTIVSQDWISACYEAGRMVPTNPYEVVGDPVGVSSAENTLQRAREHIVSGDKLFKDQVFWFYGTFTRPTQDELSSLITLGGGRIETSGDELPAAGDIICSSRLTTTEAGRLVARYHKKPVACAWILDCISAYEVLRKDKYVAGDAKNSRYVYRRAKHGR